MSVLNRIAFLGLSAVGVALFGIYLAGLATAEGIPTNPSLYYSGILEESGARPSGTRNIKVGLHASESGPEVCPAMNTSTVVVNGAFRVALDAACVDAVKANANLLARVTVDNMYSLPFTRLGAVPYAVESQHAVSASNADNGVPMGTVIAWAANLQSKPPGWLPCDGKAYASSAYPDLAAALTIAWGNGSANRGPNCNVTNCDFNVPDLRGRFLRGLDSGAGLDPDNSRVVGSLQADALRSHKHRARGLGSTWLCVTNGCPGIAIGVHREDASYAFDLETTGVEETRPVNAAVVYLVRCGPRDACQ